MTEVDIPISKIGHRGMFITLNPDILEWLLENVGFGDTKYWDEDDLIDHLANCHDGEICMAENNPCSNDVWGWTIFKFERRNENQIVRFIFRDADAAMLFKLTWF